MNKHHAILIAAISLSIGFTLTSGQIASACSSSSSTSSGLQYGSATSESSVTVCVGETTRTGGTSSTASETKTTTSVSKPKAKPSKQSSIKISKPKSVVAKAPVKKEPAACPSPSQISVMPKSADAVARWIDSLCAPKPKSTVVSKPSPKKSKPVAKSVRNHQTSTVTTFNPGSRSSLAQAVTFRPNALVARYTPNRVLGVGEVATFSTNPTLHFRTQSVLGRLAEVKFNPTSVSWDFSDGGTGSDSMHNRSFADQGSYWAVARVRYQVSYRLVGETDWKPAGIITVSSNLLEVLVGEAELLAGDGPIVLVGEDCLERPGSYGCTG